MERPFRHSVIIGPKDGTPTQRVITLVGTGNKYTIMPSTLLSMLGITPEWREVFSLPDLSTEEYPLAEVRLGIDGRERTTICIFGKPESEPTLGVFTLDAFGLTVDEVDGKLIPATQTLV